ncbi:hypothetical protein [Kribbella sp. CA-293567]|uniref:hypothetical protein n=1 Tax=Kribbella sp. CA-293567 TaxID=3002436 RepID=UPI0022DE93BB|nr:hypothetical protein [Kribbella sp. CA-293567]WBQ03820.1 hypothetical protein OX958_28100 [Kribbella sp. CA-293567]
MTAINDRVRITRAVGESRARTDGGGVVGRIESIDPSVNRRESVVYGVRSEGTGFIHSAYEVVPVAEPTPAPEPEAPVLIDQARAQALYAASVVLGGHEHALAEDVVRLAEFIIAGEAVQDAVVVNVNATSDPTATVAAAVARPDTSRRLHITDNHGDRLTVTRGDFGRHSSRVLATIRTSDGSGANPVDVYLRTPAERDELVAYLQAL